MLPLLGVSPSPAYVCDGAEVGVRILKSNGEYVQELVVKDSSGKFIPILGSPTHPAVSTRQMAALQGGLGLVSTGLFAGPPSFRFDRCTVTGRRIVLTADTARSKIVETIDVPEHGRTISARIHADLKDDYPQIRFLLTSYAFLPGNPDSTWTPGLRSRDDMVIGDHFFRSPAVVVQKGRLSAILMPDLDVLKANRPMPTILDLDCDSPVTSRPLLSYGFSDYRLVSHVAFASDGSMTRPVPPSLDLGFEITLSADTAPYTSIDTVVRHMWDRYGASNFAKVLPQAMPFADYAKVCYPAAMNEKETGGWFELDIDGHPCGGVPSGWGRDAGWVSHQAWFNQLRSAWGMRWWGKKLGDDDWVRRADLMLNLALAAPMDRGACPTTYDSHTKQWRGSLINPTPDTYYDLTNIAWKGISLIRWLEFADCPRRDAIERQVKDMAALMVRMQNSDGSYPTWLTKEQKVVPFLDHSASSGLPGWFLAKAVQAKLAGDDARLSSVKAARFLLNEVVDKRLYYDFETFFSCSPKICLQRDGKVDDLRMWDRHTLQPPQNTLSMQWTAEALREAATFAPNAEKPAMEAGAMKALDVMCLYQNVWPISYRPVAYTYGGFGVQNSDGEYNDARQAQFAETLCDFGVQFGRKDLFERGVAAARASLTLINHPLHEKFGIYPSPNYPLGLEPENCGHGGTNEQDGRTGFDWGEGSGLSAMATLMDRFGATYAGFGGSVVVDGGTPTLPVVSPLQDPKWDMRDWHMPGWTFDGDFLQWPSLAKRAGFGNRDLPFIGTCEDGKGAYEDVYTGTITSPEFVVSKSKIKLLVGGGSLPGVYVELLDGDGKRIYVERGKNDERMDERTWDVSAYRGKPLRIRIVDREKDGWGHLNVGDIRTEG